ncbi:ubiquitin-protein ligase-like protein [Calycina marina]|uniref:Ubiquitin-protein ligase-like protein n=1 Tax=Calycina marina TaxID=1763456 RepID=A0A9P7Z6B5_9HELO|nr:ubiquitin-protein ligase-like protein [Calycina marina]
MATAAINPERWGNWTLSINMTQLVPSARDLALAGPRMVMRAKDAVNNLFGGRIVIGQRIIPEATGAGIVDAATTAVAAAGQTRDFIQGGTDILVEVDDAPGGIGSRFSIEGARSLGSVFSYATSKWALCCLVMAVVLNRTHIFASTRRNITLPWKVRLFARMAPIALLAVQARWLLQSIQCQTSPDFGELRWGNASKHSDLMFTQNGGLLHTVSSMLLFGATDEQSCLAVQMIPPDSDGEEEQEPRVPTITDLTGSLSLLWPLFKTFSFSQFVETLSCAVQGRQVAAELGMTLFEHSLAFAEAEAAIGQQLGWGTFGGTKMARLNNSTSGEGTQIAITRAMIMKRVNTTPEILLVGFLSSMNHITSHALAIFNLQGKLRLINTGFWGLSFMSFIVWSIFTFSINDFPHQSLLRFPTVSIVGFIPHVLVLAGILTCMVIYGAALLLSAFVPPNTSDGQNEGVGASFFQRIMTAHRNMQANVPLGNIRITMHMDFYTALLRSGFSIMTMASEAVYLNESRNVSIGKHTWLEEERLQELERTGAHLLGPSFLAYDSQFNDGLSDNVGLVAAKDQPMDLLHRSASGYSKEMTAQKVSKSIGQHERIVRDGVGATERSARWIMALEYYIGIGRLAMSWWASLAIRLLDHLGIERRPQWLLWLVRRSKSTTGEQEASDSSHPDPLNFWMLTIDGELTLPKDDNVDVEAETRRRMRLDGNPWNQGEEEKLDKKMYDWWLVGGWWGNDDSSGNYVPQAQEIEDDATSVISMATTVDEDHSYDWESDEENDDGRRTPTQRSRQIVRETSPMFDTPLNQADLVQLLYPKTPEQRAEAHALSTHFAHDGILTRSRYRDITQKERSKVLTSTRHRPTNFTPSNPNGKLSPEEEAQILEHLIITRRGFQASAQKSWAEGASGMGEDGPQCVVCQSSPRSIIVWPCRCLSLCDDCRVTLAMNNFDKCVCCRGEVASFSRIFVP